MSAQKTPLSRTLANYVNQQVVKHLAKLGLSMPGTVAAVNGSIVTVNFQVMGITVPQVQMPLAGPEYIRYPTQVGDKGFCVAADFYLGAMSGLGSGTAGTTRRANLSTLVFFPIGNKTWSAPDDTQAVVIYGPNGAILRDSGKKTTLTLTPDGVDLKAQHNVTIEADTKVQATVGSNSILLNTSQAQLTVGSTTFTVNGASITMTAGGKTVMLNSTGFTIDGKLFETHIHSGVTTGVNTSGPPV